jgi:ATP-binding cassette, subfamily B, bacterial
MTNPETNNAFQRAPGTPPLPATPFRFVLHFVTRRRWWFFSIILLEAANSACNITIPLALAQSGQSHTRRRSRWPWWIR